MVLTRVIDDFLDAAGGKDILEWVTGTVEGALETLQIDLLWNGSPATMGLMTVKEFIASVSGDSPPAGLPQTLAALWWDRKGEWARAHSIAQEIHDATGSAIHAYLHRKEGDIGNADYWYSRAGRQRPGTSLDEEWQGLVEELLDSPGKAGG